MFIEFLFVNLLIIQCLFLMAHDFVDLFPFNDIENLRQSRSFKMRVLTTAVKTLPAIIALVLAVIYFGEWKPVGIGIYFSAYFFTTIAVTYFIWYRPYLFGTSEEQKSNYKIEFSRTHQILPAIGDNPRPNTLHVFVHLLFFVNALLMAYVGFNFNYYLNIIR